MIVYIGKTLLGVNHPIEVVQIAKADSSIDCVKLMQCECLIAKTNPKHELQPIVWSHTAHLVLSSHAPHKHMIVTVISEHELSVSKCFLITLLQSHIAPVHTHSFLKTQVSNLSSV